MLERNLSKNEKSKQALVQWLAETHKFDYFVTLATNNPSMERQTLREKLKEWDARVNRELYGSKWHAKKADLLWWFAFLEKPASNAHWHILVTKYAPFRLSEENELLTLRAVVEKHWLKLVSSGTVDVQEIRDKTEYTIANYVAKELRFEAQYEDYVVPDQFRTK